MLTRRKLLAHGATIGVGLAAGALVSNPLAGSSQQGKNPGRKAASFEEVSGRNSLRAHAAAHGLLTGAAVNTALLGSAEPYARVLAEQYSIFVPENAMKWKALRPSPTTYSFEEGDALVAFAISHKIKVRGHNLCWHDALPDWFQSTVTQENARQFLTTHIRTVCGHYRGKLRSWDVVNEAVNPTDGRPDGLRNSTWMQLLGPSYLEIAYRTAREADPNVLLCYNEYGIEDESEENAKKREATLRLLRRLKAGGVPLDAVGIQSHIKTGSAFGSGLRSFMASAREMGLKIFITELDVNDDALPYDDVERRDQAVAAVYSDYLNLVLAEPAVETVLTWGVTDRHTWLNNTASHKKAHSNQLARPLPFDADYRPAEAFFAIRSAFDRRKAVKRAG